MHIRFFLLPPAPCLLPDLNKQFKNAAAYRSEIKIDRVMNNAIQLLPRSFKTLGEKYHDPQTRRLRIRIAVERAIADMLHELKFYYVVKTDVEDEENIPTEPYAKK